MRCDDLSRHQVGSGWRIFAKTAQHTEWVNPIRGNGSSGANMGDVERNWMPITTID
jgi:hypothetical protein